MCILRNRRASLVKSPSVGESIPSSRHMTPMDLGPLGILTGDGIAARRFWWLKPRGFDQAGWRVGRRDDADEGGRRREKGEGWATATRQTCPAKGALSDKQTDGPPSTQTHALRQSDRAGDAKPESDATILSACWWVRRFNRLSQQSTSHTLKTRRPSLRLIYSARRLLCPSRATTNDSLQHAQGDYAEEPSQYHPLLDSQHVQRRGARGLVHLSR